MSPRLAHDIRPGDIALPPTHAVDISGLVAMLVELSDGVAA